MTNLKPIVLHIFMLACLSLCLGLNSLFKSYVLILCHLDSATSLLPRHHHQCHVIIATSPLPMPRHYCHVTTTQCHVIYCHIITANAISDFETSCLNYSFVLLSPMEKNEVCTFEFQILNISHLGPTQLQQKQKQTKSKIEPQDSRTAKPEKRRKVTLD